MESGHLSSSARRKRSHRLMCLSVSVSVCLRGRPASAPHCFGPLLEDTRATTANLPPTNTTQHTQGGKRTAAFGYTGGKTAGGATREAISRKEMMRIHQSRSRGGGGGGGAAAAAFFLLVSQPAAPPDRPPRSDRSVGRSVDRSMEWSMCVKHTQKPNSQSTTIQQGALLLLLGAAVVRAELVQVQVVARAGKTNR
jgi:hypothetical protein